MKMFEIVGERSPGTQLPDRADTRAVEAPRKTVTPKLPLTSASSTK